jgi:hypothetical protein
MKPKPTIRKIGDRWFYTNHIPGGGLTVSSSSFDCLMRFLRFGR